MIQILEQTKEEQIEMFMKLPKKKLIEMLINCNNIINTLTKHQKYSFSPTDTFEYTCDGCGCKPTEIYRYSNGSFCKKCKQLT